MSYKILFFFILVLFSCKKDAEPSSILVLGHGGMGLEFSGSVYHDNSEEAFNLAYDIKECDGVEMDVRLSADGDLWAFHDEQLDEETNLSSCIETKSFGELAEGKYEGVSSEKLKRLKDMSLNVGEKRLFLDIKHYNACDKTVHNVNDFLSAMNDLPSIYQKTSQVRVVLGNAAWIPDFLAAGYHVLFASEVESEISSVFSLYPDVKGVVIKNDNVSETQVTNFLSQGKTVYIFEVRSPKKLKEAHKKNPTGVMSDDVQSAILEYK